MVVCEKKEIEKTGTNMVLYRRERAFSASAVVFDGPGDFRMFFFF